LKASELWPEKSGHNFICGHKPSILNLLKVTGELRDINAVQLFVPRTWLWWSFCQQLQLSEYFSLQFHIPCHL
jgi:hypothetical protein